MARKRYSDEDCLKVLRQVEVELAGGCDVATACRSAGISDATFTLGGRSSAAWAARS
jgi:putative transposase